MPNINCKYCNKDFYISPSRVKTKHFCSKECYGVYKSTHMEEFGNFIGRHHSVESNEKNRISHKLNPIKPLLNVKMSDDTKLKISISKRGQNTGSKHHNWKGGISRIDRRCRSMSEYKTWRTDVFTRDNFTCCDCGITGVYVTGHHKKSFAVIIKENNITSIHEARNCLELWDINNGETLCESCHSMTDNYKKRITNKNKK